MDIVDGSWPKTACKMPILTGFAKRQYRPKASTNHYFTHFSGQRMPI
jgi:hypothetical protein